MNPDSLRRDARVRFAWDESKSGGFDLELDLGSKGIDAGTSAEFVKDFSFAGRGTYYPAPTVETYLGSWENTDSWAWGAGFAVDDPPRGTLTATLANIDRKSVV